MNKTASFFVCGLLSVLASACKQDPACSELGTCGGDLLGLWALDIYHSSCSEDLYDPPADQRLVKGDVQAARSPSIEPAFSDWCSLLITQAVDPIQKVPPRYFIESGKIGVAQVEYKADGTYSTGFARTGTSYFDFPSMCVRQFGAVDKPGATVCQQLQVHVRESGLGEGSYRNTECAPSAEDPGGCVCKYDVAEVGGGGGGQYRYLSSNEIMHLPNTPNFPEKATFCRNGDSLELTGSEGEYLFNIVGLRTLSLGKVNCADGIQGPAEIGPDCGSVCGVACAGCTDGVQGGMELGVDCGPVCNQDCPPPATP
jgi:hypothetical protein